jgi:hypothetical protein
MIVFQQDGYSWTEAGNSIRLLNERTDQASTHQIELTGCARETFLFVE